LMAGNLVANFYQHVSSLTTQAQAASLVACNLRPDGLEVCPVWAGLD